MEALGALEEGSDGQFVIVDVFVDYLGSYYYDSKALGLRCFVVKY
jgi:hypothetical protein